MIKIETTPEGNALHIKIEGEEFATLKRATDAMNTLSWGGADNTPESVCENFVSCWIEDFFYEPGKMAENILDGIDTYAHDSAALHKERIAELRAAFRKVGLTE